ncbi:MAG TPA: DUF2723 domain-containing protein [Gemmatimonadaceae bacterium]|nr:DUF2723 domain-containing protein [Gemmatimonadaceae bacterium]
MRPSYRAAALVALAVFALYAATLAPSSALWDASEYITAAYVLGIPHPPGNPLFVLVGNVVTHLPLPGTSVAVRVNLLAALCSAVAAGVWFLVTERVLTGWLAARWQRLAGATAAALLGATAFTVWNQSVVNEKVYTVSLAIFAVVAWLTVQWCDDPEGRVADRRLLLIAYLLGLGYANHPAGLLPLPAVGIAVLLRRPQTLLRARLLLAGAGLFALGLTPFATQPIRAAYHPAINEGDPTGCVDGIGWACTFSATTWQRLKANIDREQYGKPALSERQAPFTAQLGMWWLYFRWQWLRDAYGEHDTLQRVLGVLFLALGVLGGWVHWRRDRRSFVFLAPLVATLTVALAFYLNFRYGYSQAPHLGDTVPREVRDRDYFYLWSFSTWSVWAALGLVACWHAAAEGLAARIGWARAGRGGTDPGGDGTMTRADGREGSVAVGGGPPRPAAAARQDVAAARGAAHSAPPSAAALPGRRAWLLASPVLLLALVPLAGNWTQAPRIGETVARDFARDLLNSVEPYGILVTAGDNDTFPLWYAQEVEGIRRDVTVAVTSLLNTDWYARGLIRRPVYEYDAANGPAVYRGRAWPKPTEPVLDMSIAEADAVPPYVVLPGPQLFVQDSLRAVVDPRRLPYGVLERADVLVLRMIRDNAGERPIYFARTMGGYPHALGLERYTLSQGLARKLLPREPDTGRDTLYLPGDGYFDVARTRALWRDAFRGPEAIARRGEWVDRASVGIPLSYVDTGLTLASALAQTGRDSLVPSILARVERVAGATRTLELLRGAQPLQPEVRSDVPRGREVPVRPPDDGGAAGRDGGDSGRVP